MQNLEVGSETIKKTRKIKEETKKELNKSIVGKKHDNKEIKEKANIVEKPDDVAAAVLEFEVITRSKKKNIVWTAYQQGNIFINVRRLKNLLR